MKRLIALFSILFLFMACAAASILLARGYFTLRTSTSPSDLPPAPTVAVIAPEGLPTPTLAAALPPIQPAPIGETAGRFNGTFAGTLTTGNGSSAPATLTFTQNGSAVTGLLDIGEGLTIDAGSCGAQAVPAGRQSASGAIDPAAPNRLQTVNTIPVAGLSIGVVLTAEMAADGQSVAARADLDLPFLCGTDPVISGNFVRQ